MDTQPVNVNLLFINESDMVCLSRELGFDGWDARDAAFYLSSMINARVYFSYLMLRWYIDKRDIDPKKLTMMLLKHGEYFV